MVQLKSFKPLAAEPNGGQVPANRRPSSSSSATVSSVSTSSDLTLGPNLTSSEDSNTTISSRDEYQMARFELRDSSTDGSAQVEPEVELRGMAAPPPEEQVQGRVQLSMSPHAPDRLGRPRQREPLSPRLAPRPLGGGGGGGGGQPESASLGQWQPPNPESHFEIRWRNIQLVARKSRLPRLLADSPLYRLFRGQPEAQKAADTYYSPPIGRHLAASPKLSKCQTSAEAAQPQASEFRTILSNISGSVFSGQITAVLGPSGVGKTSLLNSLTGRNTLDGSGRVSLIGGASKRMSVVTVPQVDILPEKLTALEDLQFTSRLKNPGRHFEHERNIQRVVRHLQMEKFLNTRIEKLSGGEARRLSIGRELLNSPDIMILDEPTSGLDANTCKKIITALRDIVEHSENYLDRPMSVIITIHQPQQEVLNLFHRCYVMALGGCAIFEGPPPSLLPHLLEHSSLARVCPVEQLNENPAIVAIEVASGEYGREVIEQLAQQHEARCLEEQLYADEACTPIATSHSSPTGYLTSTPRSPRMRPLAKSPVSVSPRVGGLTFRAAGEPPDSLAKQTPVLSLRRLPASQLDRISSITSLSYASTYDAELPEQTSKLRVDKRLRRSVVMKGDFVSHTLALMGRTWLLTTRDLFLMSIRILGFLLVAGGIVQIFSTTIDLNENVCPLYESEVDDLVGYMEATRQRLANLQSVLKQSNNMHMFFFYVVLATTMVTAALDGLVFPLQMRMFRREHKNGWYSPASFVTSQTLAQLPVDMIGPTLTILITYTLCHQPPAPLHWRQLGYMLVLCLSSLICKSQAQMVGAFLMNSVEMSVFLSCVMVCPNALLSGIAVRVSQMSLPLQYFSYGSFLRFAFESLFLMRYGYGICPCDNRTVHGYPIRASPEAVPAQLDRLARGLIDLRAAAAAENDSLASPGGSLATNTDLQQVSGPEEQDPNLFVAFIRLVTDASNMFVPKPSQLGDCSKYRSLYLMDMNIEDGILPQWISILVLMFILSRFLTYFVVRTVIKLRQ